MNPTLDLMARRTSTRAYTSDAIGEAEREAILTAAFRAPTAGNLMLYSIIEIADQALKERLAVTCDDQPFIAKAPWVLVFVADYQKWIDLFDHSAASGPEGADVRRSPAVGDLLLACSDALIAAQNAVIAAESLGIGSCYIGDILENGEQHAELLGLPPHTLPVAMLCLGYPAIERDTVPRYTHNMVHKDRYRRMTQAELGQTDAELAQMHSPHGLPPGAQTYAEVVHRRKYASDFAIEMNRSAAWWVDRWQAKP